MFYFISKVLTVYAFLSCFCVLYFYLRARNRDDYAPLESLSTKLMTFVLLFIFSPVVFVLALFDSIFKKIKN